MAAPFASPLVLTKLRVPAARPRMISRARLLHHLDAESSANLILLSAPAGYGKTTLLTEWAHSLKKSGVSVAWYALDPGDNDPIPFGSYLVASLMQALGPLDELTQIAQLLRASPGVDLQRILPVLVNGIISTEKPCVLILDDYHLITNPAIHGALAYLLGHLPENLRLVIGSRADPPLPLALLRARGQLLEIRSASLRFTVDETAQFLNEVMRLDLPTEGIAALEERTEGWVAGLQLASLALVSSDRIDTREAVIPAFSGGHRYLVEYLMEEVVNRQPEAVQLFLLLTSVLERMCAPLCDAIVQSSGSEAILKHLEQANLFIVALDDDPGSTGAGCWYRYHHLFRDFLLTWLKRTQPRRIPILQRAACEWLAANHFLREAAAQAFQTRDWEYAAAFVEQHSFTMIIHSEIATMYEWCSAFPEEVLLKHPGLCILQCYGPAFRFQRQERGRIEARLQQAEQMIAKLGDRQAASGLKDSASVVRSFLSLAPDPMADPQPQIEQAQRMITSYPEGEAGQFSGLITLSYAHLALWEAQAAQAVLETARRVALLGRLYFGVVESTFHLARLAHNQGLLRRSIDLCKQGRADITPLLAHPEQELPALGSLEIAQGCVMLEQDQLAEAEHLLLHGLSLVGWGMNPYYLLTACVALFRLREIQGRPAEALTYLEYLEAAWPDITFCTAGLRAVHALRSAPGDPGVLSQADAWAQQFNASLGGKMPLLGMGPFGAFEGYYLTVLAWVQVQIAAGTPQAARPYLQELLNLAKAHCLTARQIELTLLEAQADEAEGNFTAACSALQHALALAQPEGFIRAFDQAPGLTQLLAEYIEQSSSDAYARRVWAAITRAPQRAAATPTPSSSRSDLPELASPSANHRLVDPLSERELEILRLMAAGATNQTIAAQLVITIGTVKSHINHILGKLDARNRTEAVARARALSLLN